MIMHLLRWRDVYSNSNSKILRIRPRHELKRKEGKARTDRFVNIAIRKDGRKITKNWTTKI